MSKGSVCAFVIVCVYVCAYIHTHKHPHMHTHTQVEAVPELREYCYRNMAARMLNLEVWVGCADAARPVSTAMLIGFTDFHFRL